MRRGKSDAPKATTDLNLARSLYAAMEEGDYRECERWLVKGANPNLLLPEGSTPFHYAVGNDASNCVEITELCLQYGANPNVRSSDGITPVHVSSTWGKADVLEVLLKHGGNPGLVDEENDTALDLAIKNGHQEVISVLLKYSSLPLSMASLSLDDDTFLLKKATDQSSLVIPKTPTFSKPHCCLNSSKEVSICQPAETSFRLRRSISDSLFSKSYWNMEQSLSQTTPEPLRNLSRSFCASGFNDRVCKRLLFDQKISTTDSSAYVTCNETSFFHDSNKTTSTTSNFTSTPFSRLKMTRMNSQVLDNVNSPFSPGEFVACDPNTKEKLERLFESSIMDHEDAEIVGDSMVIKKKSFTGDRNVKFSTSSLVVPFAQNSKEIEMSKCANDDTDAVEEYVYFDKEEGVSLIEKRLPSNTSIQSLQMYNMNDSTILYNWHDLSKQENDKTTDSVSIVDVPSEIIKMSNSALRAKLKSEGDDAGPITKTTRSVYEMRLARLLQYPQVRSKTKDLILTKIPVYSKELSHILEAKLNMDNLRELEQKMCKMFDTTNKQNQNWREGRVKNCFNYLLLDPRITNNLPARSSQMPPDEQLKTFLAAIFYIGKGKRARPYAHLYEAALYLKGRNNKKTAPSTKVQHILNIWADGEGVISLHCFQNVVAVEAYTREACMIDSIGLNNVSNVRKGDLYEAVSRWTGEKQRQLGAFLLYRACNIFLNEGERQIRPSDV